MIDPHFQKLFALGLNIEESWYIASIEMEPAKRDCSLMEMHIKVDFAEGATFTTLVLKEGARFMIPGRIPGDITISSSIVAISRRGFPGALHPIKVKTVAVPWVRSGSEFTLMMEGVILTCF